MAAGAAPLHIFLMLGMVIALGQAFPQGVSAANHPKRLRFYMYVAVQNNSDINNPKANYTAVQSAQPPRTEPFAFGIIHTFDNPLTTAPDLGSRRVGRVQGYYGNVGQSVLTLFLVQTFTYDDGKHRGTFSLVGVDVVTDKHKLSPIVGGTGDFSYARGIADQVLISTSVVNNMTTSWFRYSVKFKY
ncbi:hypothetical protein KP509_05G078700 [Ceratopteris richardii]|uniref:Dirigent protein n=1 Tax=Ceratopteris richardii TaxID=49495 RepID=A0A8T2US37_CERRI|nr:hypothetical protein KP509_05G078700 [Ceratopteris richardii]